ncbi:Reverse transcriptase (RNA-dependent DNA polymerase), putative [Entamoeba histolytica]
MLYETQVILNKENWKIKQNTSWNERYRNYDNVIITINELNLSIMRISNWKAPGIDTIYGYYWKMMSSSRETILSIFNEWLNFNQYIPLDMVSGRTLLIHKGGDRNDVTNYRHISCTNVIMKVFTSILKEKIHRRLNMNSAKEGIINSYMLKQKEEKYPKYVESYYDIKKAYDTVNHEWVIESLKYFNVEFVIIDIIESMMTRWKIFIGYKFNEYLGCIKLNRGILQCDSLSNLLFIIQMNVISQIIEEKFPKSNHILYMDDLRIMTESSEVI